MKRRSHWMVIPTVLSVILAGAGVAQTKEVIELSPGFKNDPLTLSGTSGGQNATRDCGKIAATANHVIKMNGDFPYLRFSLQSAGQPTLLIQEPGGRRTCISSDRFSNGSIQSPGFWKKGNYSIYIGDRTGGRNHYTLSLTQQAN